MRDYKKKPKGNGKYGGFDTPWVWQPKRIDWDSMTFEEKIQFWIKESRERNKESIKYHTDAESCAAKEENNERRKIAARKKNRG